MQHLIEEIEGGHLSMSTKNRDGSWTNAYFVQQSWGPVVCFSLPNFEPFLDTFKKHGGVAFQLLTDRSQFSASTARVFFKFGAPTIVPPGPDLQNPTARILSFDDPDFFKAGVKFFTSESDSGFVRVRAKSQRILFLPQKFFQSEKRIQCFDSKLVKQLLDILALEPQITHLACSKASSPTVHWLCANQDSIDISD